MSIPVAPHSIQAEEGVLGSVLVENSTLDLVESIISVDDFYSGPARVVYGVMLLLRREGVAIDVTTLQCRLETAGRLGSVGGVSYLAGCLDATPTSTMAETYAQEVRDLAVLRRTIGAARVIVSEAQSGVDSIPDFAARAQQLVAEASQQMDRRPYRHVKIVAREMWDDWHSNPQPAGGVTGIQTGLCDLDTATTGLHPGELVVIAGRPSMGKTALSHNIAIEAVRTQPGGHKHRILICSLEMSERDVIQRLLCMIGGISVQRMRARSLQSDDYDRMIRAQNYLDSAPIWVDDTPALTLAGLRGKARRLRAEQGLDLVIVDYLQLMRASVNRDSTREREVASLSMGLKEIAKEFRVPVIALSQLNRALESRADKRPTMSDLRESGAIEQDADLIVFVYRDVVYNPDSADPRAAELIIGKQRNGPCVRVRCSFDGRITRFRSREWREHVETTGN
jgi:replicative DNA helicase